MNDEFYIGYLDRCPTGLASALRRWVGGLGFLSVLLLGGVAAFQGPAEPGQFEYGIQRTFEGVLLERPLPMLRVPSDARGERTYLLVGSGKFGLSPEARRLHGRRVRVHGSIIQKGSVAMIEWAGGEPIESLPGPPSQRLDPGNEVIGPVELVGELVDTKCYLGVMRPATGKVHRGCAARCLSGGVPPGLLVRTTSDEATVVLLVPAEGSGWAVNPEWAARTVRMGGVLSLRDGLPILAVQRQDLLDDR